MADDVVAFGHGLSHPLRSYSEFVGISAPVDYKAPTMSTPQDSPKRRKQKARRTKQLLEWREKKATAGTTAAPALASAAKSAK